MPAELPHLRGMSPQDTELSEYRALSGLAVVGFVLGLLSVLGMVYPALWVLPPLGAALSGLALWRIARADSMTGRRLALAGLALSAFSAAAGPSHWLAYRALLQREARQFAGLWFQYLAEGQPYQAHQLTLPPGQRRPPDPAASPRFSEELQTYASQPLVRTLLDLGHGATVRYYQAGEEVRQADVAWFEEVYAVSYEEGTQRKTFFVSVWVQRLPLEDGGVTWVLFRTEGGVKPEGW